MNINKKIVLLIIIVLGASIVGYNYLNREFKEKKTNNPKEFVAKDQIIQNVEENKNQDQSIPNKKSEIESWKTYKDDNYGFQFMYPSWWNPQKLSPKGDELLSVKLTDLKEIPLYLINPKSSFNTPPQLNLYKADGFTIYLEGHGIEGYYYRYNSSGGNFELWIKSPEVGQKKIREGISFDELLKEQKGEIIKTKDGFPVLKYAYIPIVECLGDKHIVFFPHSKMSNFVLVFSFGACSNDSNLGENYKELQVYIDKYRQVFRQILQTLSLL